MVQAPDIDIDIDEVIDAVDSLYKSLNKNCGGGSQNRA